MSTRSSSPACLVQGLTFWDALSLVVGSMIGTGVFLKSAAMAQGVGSGGVVLLAWVAAGLLSLSGAFTYAEMGSRYPKAGGEYVYLREAYGDLPAFLYGWTRFWIAAPGSVAAYGVGAATFLHAAVPLDGYGGRTTIALLFIVVYTVANGFAVSIGGKLQTIMTAVKAFLILGLAAGILLSVPSGNSHLVPLSFTSTGGVSAFGSAMLAALWAYDGWNNLPMAAGEVKNSSRNVPLALAIGTFVVLALYGLLNVAYFYALPFAEVVSSSSSAFPQAAPVATKAAMTFLGPAAVGAISIAFVISALGAMNGSILTGARVPYAMALDGNFFKLFAHVSPKSHVPTYSVAAQGVWACCLALSGTFDQLTDAVVFSSWIFYGLVTFAVFRLRKRSDVPPATFKAWGFPFVPAIFLAATVFLLANTIVTMPKETGLGLALIGLGVPAFYFFKRKKR